MRGVAERHGDEIRLLRLQHRDVGALVGTDHLGREAAVVEQGDGDLARVLDDVVIGDDVAVLRVDDHAGARALELPLTRPRVGRHIEEAAEEGIVQQRIALTGLLFDGAARRDVHHGGRHALDHGRERGHRRRFGGGGRRRGECGESGRRAKACCEQGGREETENHGLSSSHMVRCQAADPCRAKRGPDLKSGPRVATLGPRSYT